MPTINHSLVLRAEVPGDREVGPNEGDDDGTLQVYSQNHSLCLRVGDCCSVWRVQSGEMGETKEGQTGRQEGETTALVCVTVLYYHSICIVSIRIDIIQFAMAV